jgi:CRP-like cAMP-binding protein
VWDGDRPQNTCLLLSGYAYRHKLAGNGGRQILSIHMKGDVLDLQNSLLGIADHNVQMLTAGEVVLIPVDSIRELAFNHPSVGLAMWYETLVEGSIFREWVLNIGRRNARTRIAHLLCEFALRLEIVDLGQHTTYELPITQEQLADAVALTSVHVNRTLMNLEQDGLITRTRRVISVVDWKALVKVADFEPRYLHLDRPPPPFVRTAGRFLGRVGRLRLGRHRLRRPGALPHPIGKVDMNSCGAGVPRVLRGNQLLVRPSAEISEIVFTHTPSPNDEFYACDTVCL